MDKMCGKRLGCIFMQHSPPRGLQKISNSQKFQQELEILWGKHATEAPTHTLYHHLTQVEQFFPLYKAKLLYLK